MKKVLLSLALLAGFVGAKAQSDDEGGISFGAKAGVALSNIVSKATSGGSTESIGNKTGFTLGGFAKIPVSGGFSVQPEINFSALGAKGSETLAGFGSAEVNVSLNYIGVPVLAQYEFGTSGFHLYAGPQLGVLLSAKQKSTVTFGGQTQTQDDDIKDELKTTEFSLVSGAAFRLPNLPIRIDLRSQLGLSNISKDGSNSTERVNAYMLTVGYTF